MCLSTVDKTINRKHLKREGKYVICWKVVGKRWGPSLSHWAGSYMDYRFKPGWNISKRKRKFWKYDEYIYHFHAYMSKSAAQKHTYGNRVVRCKTFLKYITATGRQGGNALVTTKIWIPEYPNVR